MSIMSKTIEFPLAASDEVRAAWIDLVTTRFGLDPNCVVVHESTWVDGRGRVAPRLIVGRRSVRLECELYLQDERGNRRWNNDTCDTVRQAYARTVRVEAGSIDTKALGGGE